MIASFRSHDSVTVVHEDGLGDLTGAGSWGQRAFWPRGGGIRGPPLEKFGKLKAWKRSFQLSDVIIVKK